ncbi:SDR family oxidoreductase [Neobacillus niacini]|uniref:SDR family oxidoreductase n=1 Tax=Neobacillus niacini TaxID=86668 RepID=UPI0021CAEBB5|nr:SDR family oxidoreductase [Neobacillus niacini]MCM3767810.1 SDR family oxidoreductase [Neobacillus niacini]
MSLVGKRVVVVGGTSGIGLATAKAFLEESANVIIASRSVEKLSSAKQSLGDNVEGYQLDFRNETNVKAVFEQIGEFDHLVVTAGDAPMGLFSELPVQSVKEAFEGKFWGQYLTVHAAIPYLKKGGSITLTTGVFAVRPSVGATTLAAINSAVEGLARGLSLELAPTRVNVVSPGLVDTPIFAGMPEEQRQGMFAAVASKLPIGRVATAEDVAQSYLYLAKNTIATGTVVYADGGTRLV